jgi:hypothetical protein
MALVDDGDPVRGVGLVTIYSAYLEEQIDQLLTLLESVEPFPIQEQRWPISRKMVKAKRLVSQLKFEDRDAMLNDLDACTERFEWRNEVVHGRIYGGANDRPDTLKSGRPNVPDRPVDTAELYQLANDLDALRASIFRPMLFQIPRALASK